MDISACPVPHVRDDRKSAALADARVRPHPGARVVGRFAFAREILRNSAMLQAGASADVPANMTHASVFFLDGEEHKRRRTAIARFFTPKAIANRYLAIMERQTDVLLAQLQARGSGHLDQISFQLAVAVAAEIVGLTDSDQAQMARRIRRTLLGTRLQEMTPLLRRFATVPVTLHALNFFARDVRPAIRARRLERQEDVISHLLDEGYSDRAILIECMTYAVAGMVTTREFIVMAAWHMFDDDALRARFVAGDEAEQLAILDEILRLEPVAAMLHRRAADDIVLDAGPAAQGELLAVNIRAANVDEAVVGECPYTLDPDRAKRMGIVGSYMSFGDGSHRCPGSHVALGETRVFLDRLMKLPGIRLQQPPHMTWFDGLMSYELRGAVVACERS